MVIQAGLRQNYLAARSATKGKGKDFVNAVPLKENQIRKKLYWDSEK